MVDEKEGCSSRRQVSDSASGGVEQDSSRCGTTRQTIKQLLGDTANSANGTAGSCSKAGIQGQHHNAHVAG
jgi:hypothetical protein